MSNLHDRLEDIEEAAAPLAAALNELAAEAEMALDKSDESYDAAILGFYALDRIRNRAEALVEDTRKLSDSHYADVLDDIL